MLRLRFLLLLMFTPSLLLCLPLPLLSLLMRMPPLLHLLLFFPGSSWKYKNQSPSLKSQLPGSDVPAVQASTFQFPMQIKHRRLSKKISKPAISHWDSDSDTSGYTALFTYGLPQRVKRGTACETRTTFGDVHYLHVMILDAYSGM